MKKIFTVLCFVVAISAQNSGNAPSAPPSRPPKIGEVGDETQSGSRKPQAPPGCANPPENVKMSDCCTNFPKFFSKEMMANNCSSTCSKVEKGKMMCCATDCGMNAFGVLTNGKFDATKAKASIAKLNADNKAWTSVIIGSVVDGCVANASVKLNEWRSKAPADMAPNCSEATSLNMVIGQCIRRELFFQCPGLSTTDKCKALVDFGKGCAFFPFHDGAPGSGDKKKEDGKNVKKSGSSGTKSNKEDGSSKSTKKEVKKESTKKNEPKKEETKKATATTKKV